MFFTIPRDSNVQPRLGACPKSLLYKVLSGKQQGSLSWQLVSITESQATPQAFWIRTCILLTRYPDDSYAHYSLTNTTLNHLEITTKWSHAYHFHCSLNWNSRIFQHSKTCLGECNYYSRDQIQIITGLSMHIALLVDFP